MICVMNCCRIINNILITAHESEGKTGALVWYMHVLLCAQHINHFSVEPWSL